MLLWDNYGFTMDDVVLLWDNMVLRLETYGFTMGTIWFYYG